MKLGQPHLVARARHLATGKVSESESSSEPEHEDLLEVGAG